MNRSCSCCLRRATQQQRKWQKVKWETEKIKKTSSRFFSSSFFCVRTWNFCPSVRPSASTSVAASGRRNQNNFPSKKERKRVKSGCCWRRRRRVRGGKGHSLKETEERNKKKCCQTCECTWRFSGFLAAPKRHHIGEGYFWTLAAVVSLLFHRSLAQSSFTFWFSINNQ